MRGALEMRVCVQGLWHLGSVIAASLASIGHSVVGYDENDSVVFGLIQAKAPISEGGLNDLVAMGLADGALSFCRSKREAMADVDILWIAYDTPVDEEDVADINYVISQIIDSLNYLPTGTTVLISSQLPVGSIMRLEQIAKNTLSREDLKFASAPENLRLGKAIEVFLNPDRMIVGIRPGLDYSKLEVLLKSISKNIVWMSIESSEMTKHAINTFLAMSIAFANELATICEIVGADSKEVERGLKSEERIGSKAYLSPGGAFAGGTLARDINFLNKIGEEKFLSTPLIASIKQSNDNHKNWVKNCLMSKFPDLSNRVVGIWGLTYKPGTNTLRRSLAIELGNWLIESGVLLNVHDPMLEGLPQEWLGRVNWCSSPLDVFRNASALVVTLQCAEYLSISTADIESKIEKKILFIDPNRYLNKLKDSKKVDYVAVGFSSEGLRG